MGGLNAWRKFEPDKFTDEQVETFKADWRTAHPNIKRCRSCCLDCST